MIFPSTVTTKGQVTIPKAVREHLHIDTGTNLLFTIEPDDKRVYIHVEEKVAICVLCKGSGQLKLSKKPCFLCLEKGEMSLPFTPLKLFPIWLSKYKVNVSFHMKNVRLEEGQYLFVPEVYITQDEYRIGEIQIAKDLSMIFLFKEFVARDTRYLSKEEINYLLSRLDIEKIKNNVPEWFELEV